MHAVNIDICKKLLHQRLLQLDQLQVTGLTQTIEKSNISSHVEPEPQRITHYYALRERLQIERALARIKQNDYGWCKDCGHHIEADRLQMDPATELCTRCAHDGDH